MNLITSADGIAVALWLTLEVGPCFEDTILTQSYPNMLKDVHVRNNPSHCSTMKMWNVNENENVKMQECTGKIQLLALLCFYLGDTFINIFKNKS